MALYGLRDEIGEVKTVMMTLSRCFLKEDPILNLKCTCSIKDNEIKVHLGDNPEAHSLPM